MDNKQNVGSSKSLFVLGLVLLLVMVAGAVALVWLLWLGFTSLEDDVAKAMITASCGVLAAALTVVVTKIMDTRREIKKELRQLYAEPYQKYITAMFDMMLSVRNGGGSTVDAANVEAMNQFSRSLILWGSDKAVAQWAEFRMTDWDAVPTNERAVRQITSMTQLMLAMRSDFGHKNRGVDDRQIASVFLTADAIQSVFGGSSAINATAAPQVSAPASAPVTSPEAPKRGQRPQPRSSKRQKGH
ncbi:MAG: hypothetical protein K0R97_1116 [Oerskovia sp.]|nr:hypothetical protein [Oerskovia sp.]